ncbi:MAG: hypothetical protein WCQ86_01420 [Bacteroidaceae bacterium]
MCDAVFVNLMTKRIYQVLLVANLCNVFKFEDGVGIDGNSMKETSLFQIHPPNFTFVSAYLNRIVSLQPNHLTKTEKLIRNK